MSSSAPRGKNKNILVKLLRGAGIDDTDEQRLLYCREAVGDLLDFATQVMERKKLGMIDGVPGTGKSSTLWYKMLCLAQEENKTIVWIHFGHGGTVENAVRLSSEGLAYLTKPMNQNQMLELIVGTSAFSTSEHHTGIEADVLVYDGVSHEQYRDAFAILKGWRELGFRKNPPVERAGFITMSNKIEREHPWQIRASDGLYMYHTQHSWELQELQDALINPDGTRSEIFQQSKSIFEKEWEIEGADTDLEAKRRTSRKRKVGKTRLASVKEIVSQKYYTTGGSARWMFQHTTLEAEVFLRRCLTEVASIDDVLTFNMGPSSPGAKTHLYSSMKIIAESGLELTGYGMVSERATQLVVQRAGTNGIKSLYSHARLLQNPAFLGWVVEADYIQRCRGNNLTLCTGRSTNGKKIGTSEPVPFDCAELKLLLSYNDLEGMKDAVKNLVPTAPNKSVICKPKA